MDTGYVARTTSPFCKRGVDYIYSARYDYMGETVSITVADTPEKLSKFASAGARDANGYEYVYGMARRALRTYYNRWIHRKAYLVGEKYEVLTPLV